MLLALSVVAALDWKASQRGGRQTSARKPSWPSEQEDHHGK